jgi:hypothetical protein
MIALISKDAGGAEFISRYIIKKKKSFCIAAAGPAINVFKKNFVNQRNISRLEAIKKSDWILCSTGTSSDYEKDAIILAKKNNKKVIAYIDHWVEYRKRFLKHNRLIQPDEIWVSDKYAYLLAKKSKLKFVKIKGNPFLSDFLKYKKNRSLKKKAVKNNILFLSEIVSKDLKKYYDEIKCLKYLLKNLSFLKINFNKIQIRPHPSEKKNKFVKFAKGSRKIFISNKNHIYDDILNNRIIVGISTIALVLGLLAKKKVISCIPGKKKCELPHKKILNFNELINENKKKN